MEPARVVLDDGTLDIDDIESRVISTLLYLAVLHEEAKVHVRDLGLTDMHPGQLSMCDGQLLKLRQCLTSLLYRPFDKPIYLIVDTLDNDSKSRVDAIVSRLESGLSPVSRIKFRFKIMIISRLGLSRPRPGLLTICLDDVDQEGRTLFQWLVYGKQLLHTNVLRVAIRVQHPESFSPEANFSNLVAKWGHGQIDTQDGMARLINYPLIREFLLREQPDVRVYHANIARVCLEYLINLQQDQGTRDEWKEDSFEKYAARHWSAHLHESEEDMEDLLRKLVNHTDVNHYCKIARGTEESSREESATFLHIASELGHDRVVAQLLLLLQEPDEVNRKDDRGRTSLLLAAQNGHRSVVELLLAQGGIDVNEKDDDDRTPLSVVAHSGYYHICDALLERHANVDQKTNGLKPVFIAASAGKEQVFGRLINATTNGPENGTDATFLHQAAREGSATAASLLLQNPEFDKDAPDQDGLTPLYLAIEHNRGAVATLLRRLKASTEVPDPRNGETLIFKAISSDNPTAANWLLSWGARMDAKNDAGRTPLHVAVSRSVRNVQVMLDYGAPVNEQDNSRQTPLHVAVSCGDGGSENVQALIAHNADVTARDGNGNTALHLAAGAGAIQIVQILLQQDRSSLSARNSNGETPLHKGASGNQTGDVAGRRKDDNGNRGEVVEILIQEGAKADARDHSGQTPLHIAVTVGNTNAARLLIKYGVNIQVPDNDGHTPLHVAAGNGNEEIVNTLLLAGADTTMRDNEGRTALLYAEESGISNERAISLLNKSDPLKVSEPTRCYART
jgi:ankyrin repeat protein